MLQAKAAWAVLSFRTREGRMTRASPRPNRRRASRLAGPRRYFFHIYRWGKQLPRSDDMRIVFVGMLEQVSAYASENTVLLRHDNGSWTTDRSMPT